jgi:ankyrin repeat protein
VNLSSMAGDAGQLEPIPADATVRELARAIREHMAVPIASQNLILKGELITDPTLKLSDVFGPVEVADLMVVKRALTEEEHAELYANLIRATTVGDAAEVAELLKEGARLQPVAPEPATKDDKEEAMAEDSDDYDADPCIRSSASSSNCGGLSPLMMASALKNEAIATQLREKGAEEPDLLPRSNSLASAFAALDLLDVVRHLAGGADVNTTLERGQGIRATSRGTPLHACCAMHRQPGAYEVAQLIIKMKADMSKGDAEGDTPLAHAKYFGASQIFQLLESNGAVVAGPYYCMFGRR